MKHIVLFLICIIIVEPCTTSLLLYENFAGIKCVFKHDFLTLHFMDVCTSWGEGGSALMAKLEFKGQAWLTLGTRLRGELMCEPLLKIVQ